MFRVLSHRVCVLAHACNRSLSGNSRSVMVFRGYGNCKECQPVLSQRLLAAMTSKSIWVDESRGERPRFEVRFLLRADAGSFGGVFDQFLVFG